MSGATQHKYYNKDGDEVELCTRRICDDPNCPDIYDAQDHSYCGHGWEVCELCGTDHRVSNVLKDWPRSLIDNDLDYISDWGFKLADAEMKVMARWHIEEGGGAQFVIGTDHSHALRERINNSSEILAKLPKWPPPLRPGTTIQLRNLVRRAELNGREGNVTRWLKKKQKYAVVIEGYMDNQEFLVEENNIQVCTRS